MNDDKGNLLKHNFEFKISSVHGVH